MTSFSKKERLCSHILIQELLKNGNSMFVFPFRCIWAFTERCETPLQIAFSVPKKRFKHAHDRNLIKRRLRNAYRIQKTPLITFLEQQNKSILCLIVYNTSEMIDYSIIEEKINSILNRIEQQLFVPLVEVTKQENV